MESLRMIGREALLADISAALDRPGAVVSLVGDPGVGKTTVWTAALAGRSVAWSWTTRCLEVEANLGLAVLADFFAALPEPVVARLPEPQRYVVEVVLCREVERGEGRLGGRLLGMTALTALRELAASGAVLLGVDDLHWCDPTSLSALTFALHRLADTEIAVLATRRPNTDARLPRAVEIGVAPLTPGATADLVLATTPGAGPAHVAAVVEASAGNPLFAKELARQAAAGEGTQQTLPRSLLETLSRRLAPLPGPSRLALLDVAVRGAPGLAELRTEQVDLDLDAAFRADLVAVDSGRIRFTHPLIAAAVLETATPGELRVAHEMAAAACTDPVAVVMHRLEYVEAGEELATELDAAVEVALQRGDRIGARNLAERAWEMSAPGQQPRRGHRLMQLEGGLSHQARASQLASALLKAPGTPDARADALAWLASQARDAEVRFAGLRDALAVPGISAVAREMILLDLAWTGLHSAGRDFDAISFLEAELRATSRSAEEVPALVGELAWQKRLAGLPKEPLLQQAVDVSRAIIAARDAVPRPMTQLAIGVAGAIAVLDDRHADAGRPLHEATEAAARTGEVDSWAFYSGLLALREGRLTDASRAVAAALEWQGPSAVGYARVALVCAWRGDHRAAADAAESAQELLDECNNARAIEVDFAIGFDALLQRNYADAWPPLRAAAELMDSTRYREPSHPPVLPAAVEAAAAVGEIEQALVLCARLERNAGRLASRFGAAAARRCRGAIAEALGPRGDAEACYREGAEGFAAIDVPLERARTLLALGSLQRRGGQRRHARETLQTARTIFAHCGAVGLAADTERELRRIGGRTAGSGTDLTAAESQTAECVARGMTNAEVAQTLHLSVKTVETHLSHAYRKLGVPNRLGLARALNGGAPTSQPTADPAPSQVPPLPFRNSD